ncbi:hypothetical protein LEP1GSC036_2950 [Leptospira weilii str. 2006001853]|uniref:Uncharacterized protein n=1 Tax=Leptospira weilii str. 2006001853 TaxID=1001589 RepID=A0A828Z5F4_9LEPT|nr:hypothetical protein LEP1GSC036_2950 [Leptospira weilii str. 2006001853]
MQIPGRFEVFGFHIFSIGINSEKEKRLNFDFLEAEKEPIFFRLGANSILRFSFFEAMNSSLELCRPLTQNVLENRQSSDKKIKVVSPASK